MQGSVMKAPERLIWNGQFKSENRNSRDQTAGCRCHAEGAKFVSGKCLDEEAASF